MQFLKIQVLDMVHSNDVTLALAHSLILRFGQSKQGAVPLIKLQQDKPELTGNILFFQTVFKIKHYYKRIICCKNSYINFLINLSV